MPSDEGPEPLPQRIFRSHLRAEDRLRESTVAKVMAALAGICAVIALALIPKIGPQLALSLSGVMELMVAWYLTAWLLTRRGIWHPAIAWVNVAIEVSILPAVCAIDAHFYGPEYALSAPTIFMWGGLIMLSALRSRRTLAIAAGVLGAVEYLAIYFAVIRPQLPPEPLITYGPAFVALRAFFLVATGVITALVAHFMLRKAEQALAAVRGRDLLGKYFLHERIGAGGMAEVFRATYSPEGGFEKVVAVKRILPAYAESDEFAQLFRREAQFGSLLNHPNIVQVLDVGRFGDSLFLAMEFVDGLSLRALMRRRKTTRLPVSAVAYVGAEVAGALDYMHRRTGTDGAPLGLVHRDLNPPNLLLSRIGEVKIADFGIARATSGEAQTRAGVIRGKAGYMAPEQIEGTSFDARADFFALGLTLHEALTGAPVFAGDDEIKLMKATLLQPIFPPSQLRPDTPPELDALVMAMLERDPSKRLSNGTDVRHRLSLLTGEHAPYPHGQLAIAQAVQEALLAVPDAAQLRTAPEVEPPSSPSGPSSSDAPTKTAHGVP